MSGSHHFISKTEDYDYRGAALTYILYTDRTPTSDIRPFLRENPEAGARKKIGRRP